VVPVTVSKQEPECVTVRALEIHGGLIAQSALLNLAGAIVPLLVAACTLPYLIRSLGTARFGILSLAWATLGFFYLLDLGLGRAVPKFAAGMLGRGEVDRLPALFWTSLACQGALGTMGAIALAALTPWLVDRLFAMPPSLLGEARTVFFVLAASVPLVPMTLSAMGMLAAAQRFGALNAIGVPSYSLLFLLPAAAVAFGLGLRTIVCLLVFARLTAWLAYLAACFRTYPALRHRFLFDRTLLRPLLTFGGWVSVSGLVFVFLLYSDRLLIGALVSVAAVTYYSVPSEMLWRLAIIPGSLVGVLFPAFSALDGSGEQPKMIGLFERSLRYLLLGLAPITLVLMAFARNGLRFWLGPDVAAESSLVCRILAVAVFVACVSWLPLTLLQSVGRPDVVAIFYLLEAPLYLFVAWFLIKNMGIAGAALACALRVAVESAFLFVACFRMKIVPWHVLGSKHLWAAVGLVLMLAVGLGGVALAGGGLPARLVLASFTLVGFFCAAWAYAFDPTDRAFVVSRIGQLRSAWQGSQ